MLLQESGEMYLETILILSRENERVRAIDVGQYMGYSKPSVSRAMGLLRSGGFIETDENSFIHLTEEGRRYAEKIFERHTLLTRCLTALGVEEETARADACRIEHVISDESFAALKRLAEKQGDTL